ncbi:MAG TPA: hypothetical protein VF407_20810, partial [Polyangiaceae bacterium]
MGRVAFGTAALALTLLGCRAILGIEDLEDDTALQDGATPTTDGSIGDGEVFADDSGPFDSGFAPDGCAYGDDASTMWGITQLAVGSTFSCALPRDAKEFYCWGFLGGPESLPHTSKPAPKKFQTTGTSPIAQIVAGDDFVCALTQAEEVRCWGMNDVGQSDPNPGNLTPDGGVSSHSVDFVTLPTSLAAGGVHVCAVGSQGKPVQCWGSNARLALGTGTPTTLTSSLLFAPDASAVASGAAHSCALLNDGGVRCWGDDAFGELGNGTALTDGGFSPMAAFGGFAVHDVVAGGNNTCVRTDAGFECVGRDDTGQLDDSKSLSVTSPTLFSRITPATDVRSLMFTNAFSCAITNSGDLHCWGKPLKYDLTKDEGLNGLVQLAGGSALGRVTAVA